MTKEARVEEITPKRAIQLLKRNSKNRKLNIRTVSYYADQMERGEWIVTGQGISLSTDGDIIDGQHRLSAIVKSGKTVSMFVFYDMDPKSFDRYDVGKTRSAGDIFQIDGVKNAHNISSMIKYYQQIGMKEKQAEFSVIQLKLTRHELLAKYHEGPDFWQEICRLTLRGWNHFRLYNSGFLGGFYAHVVLDKGYSLDSVKAFNDELHQLSPEKNVSTFNLRTVLIRDAMSMKRYTPSVKRAFLTKCWNAYFKNEEVKTYKISEGEKFQTVVHYGDLNGQLKIEE